MIPLEERKETEQGPEGQYWRSNTHVIGVPEGKEKAIGAEKVFENIMAEKFPNLVKDIDLQISKISMNANRINFKKTCPDIIKLLKTKR